MKELRALTPGQFERAAAKLSSPAPGSRIEAAREFGVDLSLLIEQLRLTPAKRGVRLQEAARVLGPLRGAARGRH